MLTFLIGAALAASPTPPPPSAAAAPPAPAAAAPLTVALGSREEKKAEVEAAEKAEEERRRGRPARVVVLKWPGTSADHRDENVRRVVRSRIARPDARFFPSVDLYQNGRKSPDRTLPPAAQPARVSEADLAVVRREVDRVAAIPWDALDATRWGEEADRLRALVDRVWFVDDPVQREPLFHLYAQIGRAAENRANNSPPFYEAIGGQFVNYYYYLAATLALEDPSLMSTLSDQDLHGSINVYLGQLRSGAFPTFPLDFEQENFFDLETFDSQYEVYLNGLKVDLDEQGRVLVPLGRVDIMLKRVDGGYGLSDRLVVDKFEDKAYFVRDVARKRMGIEFIEQLMLHPNECTPELAGDILTYLAIYARLHPGEEVYVAVPEGGNPNKTRLWRYDRHTAALSKVGGGPDTYPVRFSVLGGVGAMFNGVTWGVDTSVSGTDLTTGITAGSLVDASAELLEAHIPANLEFRVHYNRLMAAAGIEWGYKVGADQSWVERYWPRDDGSGVMVVDEAGSEALRTTSWNRNLYGSLGVLLGRDAGIGLGPRLALRVGWNNLPWGLQATAHAGWAQPAPFFEAGGRVRPYADIDLRGGVVVPVGNSIHVDGGIGPVFGMTAGVGTTF